MEAEEEFLRNAAGLIHFAEQEIKQFLTWTGKRSPCHPAAAEIRIQLLEAAREVSRLRKVYGRRAREQPAGSGRAAALSGTPALD